jgi:hypothetical protein
LLNCFSLPTKYQEEGAWLPIVEQSHATLGMTDSLGNTIGLFCISDFPLQLTIYERDSIYYRVCPHMREARGFTRARMIVHIHDTSEAAMPTSKYHRNVVRVELGTSSRPKRGDG